MTSYEVKGEIQLGRNTNPFERNVEAQSENHAEDKVKSELGSEHGVSRSSITVEKVTQEE